jgi:hypothetical protein
MYLNDPVNILFVVIILVIVALLVIKVIDRI